MEEVTLGSIIIALLVFSFLIFSHELGHFLFAKKCGIGVTEFSIGMGPRILSRQFGETRYSLKCIPFGGSCAMIGEDADDPAENAFNNKSVWARILVVVGGPMFNLLTAFLLSLIVLAAVGINPPEVYVVYENYGAAEAGIQVGDVITSINGSGIHIGRDIEMYLLNHPLDGSDVTITYRRDGQKNTVTYNPHHEGYRMGISYYADETAPILSEVTEGSPAAEAGLQAGDQIISLNGTDIGTGEDMQRYFEEHPADGSEISVGVLRDGQEIAAVIVPVMYETNVLGFQASYLRDKADPLTVLKSGVYEMWYWLRYMVLSLRMLVTGQVSADEVTGPVGIVSTISDTVEESASDGIFYVIMNVFNMAILLSVNLGIMNLLPIPALDGGRLIFLLVEVVRGKPLPPEKEGAVHTVGFILLMGLMVFVMYHDIVKLITGA